MVVLHCGSNGHCHTWVLGKETHNIVVVLRFQRAKERPKCVTQKGVLKMIRQFGNLKKEAFMK